MKKHKSYLLIATSFILFFLFASDSFGQRGKGRYSKIFTKKKRYYSIGTSVNSMHYFGDIVPKNKIGSIDLNFTRPNLGFFVQRRYFPRITLRMGLNFGRLIGDDHTSADPDDLENGGFYRYKRNLHFRNDIIDLSFSAIIDLFPNRGLSYRRPETPIPYILVGIGGLYSNPKAMRPEGFNGPVWVNLRQVKTENQENPYSLFHLNIPVGIGVRYRLNSSTDVAFEAGYRFTSTDYLDDVSGYYQDPGEFDNDLARALHDRSAEPSSLLSGGDRSPNLISYTSPVDGKTYTSVNGYGTPNNKRGSQDKDAYLIVGFQISYLFPTNKSPKFR